MQEITLRGELLQLLPQRAVWWPFNQALIISDLHWGKSAHFRKHGIPMPGATQQADAQRLADVLRHTHARQLIIAGDLFHSKHNNEVEDFKHWREAHAYLDIHFIMGNHDILSASFYESLKLHVHKESLNMGPFFITHDEILQEGKFTIHGHIHPGVSVKGTQSFPCFAISTQCMVLPAFGRFTGCKRIEPAHYKSIYVVGEGKVLKLK